MRHLLISLSLITLTSATALQAQQDSTSFKQLQEVSVLGIRATQRTPMTYGNIGKKEISKANLGPDIPYLLQSQPSVLMTSEAGTGIGYTGLSVRGVGTTGINVSVNGVPLNDSESQGVFWVNMPDFASSLQEIQLQRGVGTTSSGAVSFGASLNMRTDAIGLRPSATLSLGGGSFGTQRYTAKVSTGLIAGHWSLDARLTHIKSSGYIDRSGIDQYAYFLQAGWHSGSSMLRLLTFGGKERTGIAWDGIDADTEKTYGRTFNWAGYISTDSKGEHHFYQNTDNYSQPHYQAIFSHRFSPDLNLSLTAHYTQGYGYTDEYKGGATLLKYGLQPYTDAGGKQVKKRDLVRRKYLDNQFYGMVANLNWRTDRFDLSAGLAGNGYRGLHYGEIRWMASGYPQTILPTDRYYDNVGNKTELSAYTKLNYYLTRQLSGYVDLQVRHVDYSAHGTTDRFNATTQKLDNMGQVGQAFTFLNPKAGLFYEFAPAHHAYASVAVAHREPNRKMYTEGQIASGTPKAERLIDYELGYGYKSERLNLNAGLYYMYYIDQFVANGKKNHVGEAILENVPESYRMGLELSGVYTPAKWLRLDASLALSKHKIKDYTYYLSDTEVRRFSNTDIAYAPSFIAHAGATLVQGLWELNLTNQYVSRQRLDNTSSDERTLPAYNVMNLRLSREFKVQGVRELRVSLQVSNLLNARYSNNGYAELSLYEGKESSYMDYYPQAPRHVMASLTIGL